ncbi:MAG: FKBP-type peptidyl-prolyl cis-trans isomerase [Bacteroidota bacterium]
MRGWQEALQLLRPGGKGLFLIPSRLAYGKRGFGDSIPPDAVLMFTIELVAIDGQ